MENFNNSIYFTCRISDYIKYYLIQNGVSNNQLPPPTIHSKQGFIDYLSSQGIDDAAILVDAAINYAFDKKYFKYYAIEKDVHEYSDEWIMDFQSILKKLNIYDKLNELTILNVGCNDATQMEKLIGQNFNELYLVDVGIRSLLNAKKIFPDSTIMNTNADSLSGISNNSIDLYLSFRTYNSSLLNTEGSISELNRVLADDGKVILSIPNGYVDKDGIFCHGLKPHGEDYIDECYPFEIVGIIIFYLSKYNFKNIEVLNSFYEIYIFATR